MADGLIIHGREVVVRFLETGCVVCASRTRSFLRGEERVLVFPDEQSR